MNPIFLIRINETNFTKSEIQIMDYILENLSIVPEVSMIELANKIDVSKSAISRFSKKIGYQNYLQFKYDIKKYLKDNKKVMKERNNENTVASNYSKTIKKIDSTIQVEQMERLKFLLLNSNKAKVIGFSETGLTAQFFSQRLASYNYDVEAVSQLSLIKKKVNLSKKDDLLIFFSFSANTDVIKETLEIAIENNVPTALITQNVSSIYKDKVDVFIELPFFEDNTQGLILDSQIILMTFCSTFINFIN